MHLTPFLKFIPAFLAISLLVAALVKAQAPPITECTVTEDDTGSNSWRFETSDVDDRVKARLEMLAFYVEKFDFFSNPVLGEWKSEFKTDVFEERWIDKWDNFEHWCNQGLVTAYQFSFKTKPQAIDEDDPLHPVRVTRKMVLQMVNTLMKTNFDCSPPSANRNKFRPTLPRIEEDPDGNTMRI